MSLQRLGSNDLIILNGSFWSQVCALTKRDTMQMLPPPSDMAVSAMAQQLTAGAGKFTVKHNYHLAAGGPQSQQANPGLSYEDVLNEDFQFNMDAHDVMVFLHIQKTGGTSFGKHLVRDLDLKVMSLVVFFFKFKNCLY